MIAKRSGPRVSPAKVAFYLALIDLFLTDERLRFRGLVVPDKGLLDLRRCERIRWVGWVIRNARAHDEIDEWQNRRGTEVNTLLWFREEYLVVLARRRDYWLLKTAYCTEKSGRIR